MQKKVGNALYVFDTTPFTITEDTNAEVIYVQNECLKGYLELNTELESKIKTFNQWLLCVNAPWADKVTTEPVQNYHLLTLSDIEELYIAGYDTKLPPGGVTDGWFGEIYQYQIDAGMIGPEEHNTIYCNAGAKIFLMDEIDMYETMTGFSVIDTDFGQHYGVIMGDSDMTVNFSYTLKPKYYVNFSEDSNAIEYVIIDPNPQFAGKNVYISVNDGESSSPITVTSNDVELTHDQPNEYSFTMPEHDVTIKAVYATEQPQNNHLLTVSNVDKLYVRGYDTKLPPGSADNAWFTSFNQHQRNAGMIDNAEHNKIYCNAGAIIYLSYDINVFESITGLDIINIGGYGQRYGFVMGDSDMTVDFSYTLKPKYHVNFSTDSNASADIEIHPHPQDQYPGAPVIIAFKNNQSSSTITVTSTDVELTYDDSIKRYSFIMPGHDVTIKAVYKPIQISINLGDTDLTCDSYEPSGTYYPNALFVAQVPAGKTVDNYTFVKSDDKIEVNPVTDHFDIKFKVSGTVTFANA